MLPIRSRHCPASAIALVLILVAAARGDRPRETDVPKGGNPVPVPRPAQAAPAKAQPQAAEELKAKQEAQRQADDERNAKQADMDRKAVKADAEFARASAAAEEQWKLMDPRERNLIDPEATAAQYELIEVYLVEHPVELLDIVDKAIRDDVLRLLEVNSIETLWDMAAKPKSKARTKALMEQLQKAPQPADLDTDSANAKQKAVMVQKACSVLDDLAKGKLSSDVAWHIAGLRAELVRATMRGETVTTAEGAKLETLFDVTAGTFTTVVADLRKEVWSLQTEEIERYLRLHPSELLKHVVSAYQDDKVTYLEYEVIKSLKEQTEIQVAKSRLKAQIQELWRIHKR